MSDPMRGHVPSLDGLRGLAIVMVLAVHLVCIADGARSGFSNHPLFKVCYAGWSGVSLFFVLSGFLITGILHDGKDNPDRARVFFARRTLRVFPLYYLALGLWLLVLPRVAPGWSGTDHWSFRRQLWAWGYAVNWGIVLRGSRAFGPFVHFWTLAIEEHFYLIWPFIVWHCSRIGGVRACAACIVAATASRAWLIWRGYPVDQVLPLDTSHLDALAAGSLIALVIRGPEGSRPLVGHAGWVAPISAIWLGSVIAWRGRMDHTDPAFQVLGMTPLVALFASSMILIAHSSPSGLIGRLFGSGFMRFLGRYSYGLYVWHGLLLPHFDRWFPFRSYLLKTGSFTIAILTHAFLSAIVTICVAWVSFRVIESPFLRFKRYFEPRRPPGWGVTERPDDAGVDLPGTDGRETSLNR